MELRIELPEVQLGVIEADGARVEPTGLAQAEEMDATCERIRRTLTIEQVAEHPGVRATRAMFRAWHVDPTKYRPSSEALLRRVTQGKGLYRISNVVDVINLCSIETGWSYGLYNRANVAPPAAFRIGAEGEKYEGIGKQTWHLAGRPVMADAHGAFGSPISDSTRTMIVEGVTEILTVIFAPLAADAASVTRALDSCAAQLERYAGARITRKEILPP